MVSYLALVSFNVKFLCLRLDCYQAFVLLDHILSDINDEVDVFLEEEVRNLDVGFGQDSLGVEDFQDFLAGLHRLDELGLLLKLLSLL